MNELFHLRIGCDNEGIGVEVTNQHEVSWIADEALLYGESQKVLLHQHMTRKQSSEGFHELKWGLASALIVISRQEAWMLMSREHWLPTAAPLQLPDISRQLSLPGWLRQTFRYFQGGSLPTLWWREEEKKCESENAGIDVSQRGSILEEACLGDVTVCHLTIPSVRSDLWWTARQ